MNSLLRRVEILEGQAAPESGFALTPAEAMAEIVRQAKGEVDDTPPHPNSPRGRLLALCGEGVELSDG